MNKFFRKFEKNTKQFLRIYNSTSFNFHNLLKNNFFNLEKRFHENCTLFINKEILGED